jgi:hypothetical protein
MIKCVVILNRLLIIYYNICVDNIYEDNDKMENYYDW